MSLDTNLELDGFLLVRIIYGNPARLTLKL